MIQTTFSFNETDEQITKMESLLEELSEHGDVEITVNSVNNTTLITATADPSAELQKKINKYSAFITNRYTDLSRTQHAN